jgi:hypothetical protein
MNRQTRFWTPPVSQRQGTREVILSPRSTATIMPIASAVHFFVLVTEKFLRSEKPLHGACET